MSWLSRLVNVFRGSKVDRDLDDELRFHIDARAEDLIEQGLPRDAAEAQAARQLGNRLRLREESRDVKLLSWLESIFQDVRFGLRMLRKDAIVSGTAMISLALAIGACTAAFSLVDALILRPLPVREPERLIYLTFPTYRDENPESDGFNYPLFERFRGAARAQADLFGMSFQNRLQVTFPDSAGQQERIRAQYISGNAFEILGVRPAIGRLLTPSDDAKPGEHAVAVLSHPFWMRRFGGDPSGVGRSFTFDGRSFEIVGVAERNFTGIEPGGLIDLWVPTMMQDAKALGDATWSWFRILGRLKNGVDPAQAGSVLQATFTSFRRELARAAPPDAPREYVERFVKTPLAVRSAALGPSRLRRDFQRPLWILAAVVGLVLLIAGSNVANLFLARAAAREHEMALRLSIGAGRGRLIQQVLIESGLLAGVACALGLLVAAVAAPAVVGMLAPADNPAYLDLRLDWRLLAFLGAMGLLTTMLFGLAPALRASGAAPLPVLQGGGGRLASRVGFQRPLVALQVGFSLAVLFVGGLLLLSFGRLTQVDLGFAKSGLLLVGIESRDRRDPEQARVAGLHLLDHLRRVPGVEGASLSAWALFSSASWTAGIRVPGHAPDAFAPYFLAVSPGFFETMRIRLMDGRPFVPHDTEPERPIAVVVNEAFAQRYFGGEPAVGRVFHRGDEGLRSEIVGVVADAKYRDARQPAPPTVYVPLRGLGTIQVRTAGDPLALVPALRREIPAVHPSLRVTEVRLQSTLVENTMLRERLLALLSGFFGLVGLLLASVGLYGVLSYAVVRRTKEIGIRVALGSRQLAIVGSVLRDAGVMAVLGAAGGLAGGVYLARFVRTLLYEVQPLDFVSVALPIGCLLVAGTIAAVLPARRAARVDPVVALRHE